MANSIPGLFAKITADASQFVAEFNRADNASRRVAASIDREVTKVTSNIKKKFSVGNIGKDLMRGLGIGSGFALAQQAANLLVQDFERAAKAAQDIEASMARQVQSTMKLIGLRQDGAAQFAAAQKDEMRARRALEDFDAKYAPKASTIINPYTRMQTTTYSSMSDEQRAQRAELIAALQEQAAVVAGMSKKADEDREKAAEKSAAEALASSRRLNEEQIALDEWYTKALADQEWARVVEHREALESQREVDEWYTKALADQDEARLASSRELREGQAELDRWYNEQVAESIQRVEDASARMSDRISRDLAEVMVDGRSASEVFRQLAKDILLAVAQRKVTDPIADAIIGSGPVKAVQSFLGFAAGGEPPVGRASVVGEDGPELFVPKSAGTILPAGRTSQILAGGGGIAVHQTNNFANGVTRQEVAAVLPQLVAAAKNAVLEAAQRGGGFRRALVG